MVAAGAVAGSPPSLQKRSMMSDWGSISAKLTVTTSTPGMSARSSGTMNCGAPPEVCRNTAGVSVGGEEPMVRWPRRGPSPADVEADHSGMSALYRT